MGFNKVVSVIIVSVQFLSCSGSSDVERNDSFSTEMSQQYDAGTESKAQ